MILHDNPRLMFEVYDLVNDTGELNNLAGNSEAAAAENTLKAIVLEWMFLDGDYLPLPITGGKSKKVFQLRRI